MKQSLLFSAFIVFFLSSIISFSQTYKVDVERIYSWDNAIPDWEQQTTKQYTYDNGGNKETNLLTLAYPSGDKLFQEKKSYNSSNNITLNIMQFWNPNPPAGWQSTSQIMYDYDGSNRLITETTQTFITGWENASQVVYEYNGANLEKETTYFYNPGAMVFEITDNSTRDLYEYSGSDVDKETSQHWETGTGWVDDEIFEVTYLSPGIISMVIESTWNTFTNMWDIERGTATYNNGLLTMITYDVFDGMGGWDLDSQSLFEYSGSLVEKRTDQDWDGSIWIDTDRELNTYDGNGNNTVSIYEEPDTGTSWVGYYKLEQDFSMADAFSLTAVSFENINFKVFPNPASDVLNISTSISIEKMEVYNIIGKKIIQSSNNKQLNVEGLKKGIYMLKVFSANKNLTKKIVIN